MSRISNSLRYSCSFFFVRHTKKTVGLFLLLGWVYWYSLPGIPSEVPVSLVLLDQQETLLAAKTADDGRWRFPLEDEVPEKFAKAITSYEDADFYAHIGVDFGHIGHAIQDNYQAGHLVNGATTISMKTVRLLSNRKKTGALYRKTQEMLQATRLELSYSKPQILALYAAHASFGGNVVGLEAAAWRYYGKRATTLSWAETATLAILSNHPKLVKSNQHNILQEKRNQLLQDLHEQQAFDHTALAKHLATPIALQNHRLPQLAPHLLQSIAKDYKQAQNTLPESYLTTTLDGQLQSRVGQFLQQRHLHWDSLGLYNVAVLITDVETGAVQAYWGNVPSDSSTGQHGEAIDMIKKPRSVGNLLHPLLYAAIVDEENPLVRGTAPIEVSKSPTALGLQFDAIHPVNLKTPYVANQLEQYGAAHFLEQLQRLGLQQLNKGASFYGKGLVWGNTEVSLWDLCTAYTNFARLLQHYKSTNNSLLKGLHYLPTQLVEYANSPFQNPAVLYQVAERMKTIYPLDQEASTSSSKTIGLVTGNSPHYRDAWAIGLTPQYSIGIWMGNADRTPIPHLKLENLAKQCLQDLLPQLPSSTWFMPPA